MSEIISFPLPAGPNFTIPDVGELNWGQEVTNFLVAIPHGVPPTAGTFTLTGDLSFGPSFGLVSKYLISQATNPSTTGFLRLAHGDTLSWRNMANSADLPLGVDASNNLTFNGATQSFSGAVNPGVANQLAYYPASTNAVSGLTSITAHKALQSDANGLPVASSVSDTTLAFLDATSSVQTQINAVVATANAALPETGGTMSGVINMGSNKITNLANGTVFSDAATFGQVTTASAPTGMITLFGAASAPTGWLLCNGTSYATASQPALFAVIGYTFGGVGANFNVPNMINNVPIGAGSTAALGTTVGSNTVTPTAQSHTHTENSHTHVLATNGTAVNVNSASQAGIVTPSNSTTAAMTAPIAAGGETLNKYTPTTGNQSDTGMSSTIVTMNASSVIQPSLGITFIIKA